MSAHSASGRRALAAAVVLSLLVGAMLAVILLRSGGGAGVIEPRGGTYVEGVAGTWQRLNPIFAGPGDNEVDQDLAILLFSGLTRLDADGSVIPDLAERWDISTDEKTYTFHLRKDLRWHDGEPLTAADVVFTIAQLTDPHFQGSPLLADAWLGVEVSAPDVSTVVCKLKQPYAPFLARNTTLGILPQHILKDMPPETLFTAAFNSAPVGSGPYQLVSLSGDEAVLTANPHYHLHGPSISTLRLRFYPDYSAAIHDMESGNLNALMVRETARDQQLADLRTIKGSELEQIQRAANAILYLNNEHVPFDDERVRTAISRAIDRPAIVDKVYRGIATPSASAVVPGTWAYAAQYDDPRPHSDEARKLLADAGWQAAPGSGFLVKEGQELHFTIRTDNDPTRVAIANEIAGQLQQVGIRVAVASTTFSVLRRDFLQQRQYDAALALWDQGPDPDLYSAWHSSQTGPDGLNIANFGDVVIDSLIAQGRTSTDIEVRREAYRQLQELWQRLSPSVVIAYPRYTYAHTKSLEGGKVGVLFSPAQRFAAIASWKL